jgi:hypothetical protein
VVLDFSTHLRQIGESCDGHTKSLLDAVVGWITSCDNTCRDTPFLNETPSLAKHLCLND